MSSWGRMLRNTGCHFALPVPCRALPPECQNSWNLQIARMFDETLEDAECRSTCLLVCFGIVRKRSKLFCVMEIFHTRLRIEWDWRDVPAAGYKKNSILDRSSGLLPPAEHAQWLFGWIIGYLFVWRLELFHYVCEHVSIRLSGTLSSRTNVLPHVAVHFQSERYGLRQRLTIQVMVVLWTFASKYCIVHNFYRSPLSRFLASTADVFVSFFLMSLYMNPGLRSLG